MMAATKIHREGYNNSPTHKIKTLKPMRTRKHYYLYTASPRRDVNESEQWRSEIGRSKVETVSDLRASKP